MASIIVVASKAFYAHKVEPIYVNRKTLEIIPKISLIKRSPLDFIFKKISKFSSGVETRLEMLHLLHFILEKKKKIQ